MGFHINGAMRHAGSYASPELPHFISKLVYDYPEAPDLAWLIGAEIKAGDQHALVHDVPDLGLEYATLVPMHLANTGKPPLAVLAIGTSMYSTPEENRRVGQALARALARSERRVAFLASGSLSHTFPTNELGPKHLDTISAPINAVMDEAVLGICPAPLNDLLFVETNPAPAKSVLARWGLIASDYVRLPLVPTSPVGRARIDTLLAEAADLIDPASGTPADAGQPLAPA